MTQQTYSVEELQAYIEANSHPELTCQSVEIAQQLLEREGHYEDLLEQSVIFIKENEALKEQLRCADNLINENKNTINILCEKNEALKSQVGVAVKCLEQVRISLLPFADRRLPNDLAVDNIRIIDEALSQLQKE